MSNTLSYRRPACCAGLASLGIRQPGYPDYLIFILGPVALCPLITQGLPFRSVVSYLVCAQSITYKKPICQVNFYLKMRAFSLLTPCN